MDSAELSVERPESVREKLEVTHIDDFDVVIPSGEIPAHYSTALEFVNSIIKQDDSRIEHVRDHDEWQRHFIFTPEAPGSDEVFIKRRKIKMATSKDQKPVASYNSGHISNSVKTPSNTYPALRSMHSVTNEFRLAPVIAEILQSVKGKELTKKLGLSSIEFVSPIFAAINTENGDKFVAYPNIKNAPSIRGHRYSQESDSDVEKEVLVSRIRGFWIPINTLFIEAGIVPFDFGPSQMLFDKDNNKLYLIDAEGWHLKPKAESEGHPEISKQPS